MPRMLKLKDAAAETGLTYSCLRRWILAGEFRDYVKAVNRIYVNMEKLVDYLNSAYTHNSKGRYPTVAAPQNRDCPMTNPNEMR